jgi:hypothetical protein
MFIRRFSIALVAVVWLTGIFPARGQETRKEGLREVVGRLAESVRKVADKLEQSAVRIGFFSPFGLDDSHAGGAFMAELATTMKDFVNPAAALELRGEYGFVENPDKSGLKVIVVRAKLIRISSGREEKEFPEFEGYIRSVTDLARIAGGNVAFKSDEKYEGAPPSEGRNKDLQKTLPPGPGKPPEVKAHIHGPGATLVSTTKESPYAVEVRTLPLAQFGKGTASARKVELENGLPFVQIEKGELYEVRVLNSSDHEIAVSLALDGIDQFTFSDDRTNGRPNYSHWIVPPCKEDKPGEVLIRGWHKTAKPLTQENKRQGKGNVLKFLVTNYGEGAVSKFPKQSQGKVGTITVGIALSFPAGSGNKGASETGFGPPEEVKQSVVKRDICASHEFITVRYNR